MPTNTIAHAKLKQFKFRVEINGFEAALVQEFDGGKTSIAVVEHAGGGQNHPDKEPGMLTFDNVVLRNVVPADGPGRLFFHEWLKDCQDCMTGNGLPVESVRRNFSFYELNSLGNPVRATEYYHAFVVGITPGNRSGLSRDQNVIDEIEICYIRKEERDV